MWNVQISCIIQNQLMLFYKEYNNKQLHIIS